MLLQNESKGRACIKRTSAWVIALVEGPQAKSYVSEGARKPLRKLAQC